MRGQAAREMAGTQAAACPHLPAQRYRSCTWLALSLLYLAASAYPVDASDPSKSSGPGQVQPQVAPVLVVVPLVQVRSSGQVPFYIIAGPPQALPPSSLIRIRGLPEGVTPSESFRGAAGSWDVPLSAVLRLKLNVPEGLTGRREFVVSLVDGNGAVLAERPSALVIEIATASSQSQADKVAEDARLAEMRRADEARQAEIARKLDEHRLAAVAKKAEEVRLETERMEAAWNAEEARRSAEAKKAEEARLEAQKAEAARQAEEARIAAEAKRIEEAWLAAQKAEAARQAEEARIAAEAKRIEEARLAAAAQATENRPTDGNSYAKREHEGATSSTVQPRDQAGSDQQGQAERLVVYGERYLAQGNIVVARQYFLRAAEARNARGALRLAETHDPRELARLGVHGLSPDPALAQRWYQRALELGAREAQARLQRLAGQ